eukprot:TRINITY_DN11194_c0_g2_i1.p1 TRINITY_DN11194_c0_g2~~TRINITY_DN11194_c0_g2_i1.p1  ORF type:complete len:642 (-),score=54.08 TRINITY_DN11194_c0_g2_i1:291-1982(-)
MGETILRNLVVPNIERSQGGKGSDWEVTLIPSLSENLNSSAANVTLECSRFDMQGDGERLVARSVVYYPWRNGFSTLRYFCPGDDALPPLSALPAPTGCPRRDPPQLPGCSLPKNISNELLLDARATTVIEYDLFRSAAVDCHINGHSSDTLAPNLDETSQNTMAIWLVASVCSCLACCLLFCALRYRRAVGRALWRYRAVSSRGTQATEAIGACMPQSEELAQNSHHLDRDEAGIILDLQSSLESSGGHFSTDMIQVLSVGKFEHWLLHPRVFTELKLVAGGGFGAVYVGTMHRSSKVALKVIKSFEEGSQSELRALTQEARILRRLRHPNIVLFQGFTTIPCDGKRGLALVLEWVEGGDLGKYLSNVASTFASRGASFERLLVNLMLDISRALLYMHSQDPVIMHRDLKPPNVLVEDVKPPRAKVTDFGLSAIIKGDFLRSKCGTRSYMAPEVAANETYDASADMYSFGAIIWFVATASHPSFDGTEESRERMKKRLRDRVHSVAFRELCEACLLNDKEGRPSADEAFAKLSTIASELNSLCDEMEGEAPGEPNRKARVQL